MKSLQVVAMMLAALLFAATGAMAAEMPMRDGVGNGLTGAIGSGFALPLANPAKAQNAIKVAHRWRRRHRHRGAAVAGAIALGVLGAIAASKAARADDRAYRRHVRFCRRMARKCDRGRLWACDEYDDRC